MGVKEAYKRIKEKHKDYWEAVKSTRDLVKLTSFSSKSFALEECIKIIEEECPEVKEVKHGR